MAIRPLACCLPHLKPAVRCCPEGDNAKVDMVDESFSKVALNCLTDLPSKVINSISRALMTQSCLLSAVKCSFSANRLRCLDLSMT